MAAPGTFAANFSHGTVTVSDGTPTTPLSKVLDTENGNLSLAGLANVLRAVKKYERRGKLHAVALGERTYPTGTFSAMLAEWSNSGANEGTLLDLILGTAGTDYASRIGTLGSSHPVVCFDIEFKFTDHGGSDHAFTCHDVHFTSDFAEGDPDTLTFSFEVLGEISGDLSMDET